MTMMTPYDVIGWERDKELNNLGTLKTGSCACELVDAALGHRKSLIRLKHCTWSVEECI